MNIKIDLGVKSIERGIREITRYQKSLDMKCRLLVERLAKEGVEVATTWIHAGAGDYLTAEISYQVNSKGNIQRAVINMVGEDVLFIEFGSGITFNHGDAPHAAKFGYGVGTYPGQTHAFSEKGWWYIDGTGLHHSYGREATYPLYHAAENARNNLISEALELFRS